MRICGSWEARRERSEIMDAQMDRSPEVCKRRPLSRGVVQSGGRPDAEDLVALAAASGIHVEIVPV
ncbi:MAG: hypothetical protein ACRDRY_02000 [Pseudonocardiaceae bacterium]